MDMSRYQPQMLWEGDVLALYRGWSPERTTSVLLVTPVSANDAGEGLHRLEHELALAEKLEAPWAAKPLALERHDGRPFLVLSDEGGTPLSKLLGRPFETERSLVIATNAAAALRKAHALDLVHKDLRPDNLLVDPSGRVWLTGFGKAGPARPEDQPVGPAIAAADLAYISPEQTGRVKRAVDARSDLYSLGVVFYQVLTGELPFVATDAMEWIHAHVARQPIPAGQRHEDVPPTLETIAQKLLAKKPEERYQTAAGLEADLKRCLDSWRQSGCIQQFDIATIDAGERLRVPEGLYGRSRQNDAIAGAFERVQSSGRAEVVLVSGPAGVGKSSVVHELRKKRFQQAGLFASGKFDQYTRDIPYATIAQAFRGLVRQILGSGDADLAHWRRALIDALGPNGQLMVNLVPELSLVIGEQLPAPDLPPQDAKARFHLIFRRFLNVFARPNMPLVLFIDDVQWLDTATIELLERITVEPDVTDLLLICAYRDDEVSREHPFTATREAMLNAPIHVQEEHLSPLTVKDLEQLLADALQSERELVAPLAKLVFDKTEGNPFFVLQFLTTMDEERLVTFDAVQGTWIWEPDRIRTKGITDNVAELVSSKLLRLPRVTLETVKLLACLGNGASLSTLGIVGGESNQQVAAILWEAIQARFVLRVDDAFVFAHDRIQEAAYLLVPQHERPAIHLRIGRALMSKMTPTDLRDRVFEVTDQIGRGLGLITSDVERAQVAELFLDAGARAKTSAAYPSALRYFTTGLSLLDHGHWERRYDLMFSLALQKAECEFLTGEHGVAETHLVDLITRAASRVDGAAVVRLLSSLYVALGEQTKAVDVGLEFLREMGIEWSAHPSEEDLRSEIEAMSELLAGRDIALLVDLPRMADPDWLAAMDVLAYMILPALLTDSNLEDLIYTQMVNLSLRYGNCDASCYAYASFIVPLGLRFGDYALGRQFGDLGLALVDEYGLDRFKARVYTCYSCYVVPWARHLPESILLTRRAIEVGIAAGDLVYAATTAKSLVSNLLVSGEPLQVVENEGMQFLAMANKAGFGLAADSAIGQLLLIRELEGRAGPEKNDLPDRSSFLQHLQEAGASLVLPLAWYWIQEMQARFLEEDYAAAVEAEYEARKIVGATRSFIDLGEYHFYSALAHAGACASASDEKRQLHLQSIRAHLTQIEAWAESCPENFSNRRSLVAAEIARLESRDFEALELYEEAVRSARRYGFIQNEALSNELAARHCASRGLTMSADAFLRSARACYAKWGAHGKVRQIDRSNSDWGIESEQRQPSTGAPVNYLDMAAVMEMSQAVSGEIVLDRLIERLMITVVEHSGAVRGLLLLSQDGKMQVVAEAVTDQSGISVFLSKSGGVAFPDTVVSYVSHTREVVILDDAQQADLFSGDAYFQQFGSTSVLCLPLVKQQQLVGILYLENSLSSHLFTEGQVAVLRLLASQAAISLENAALYREAQETHERARRAAEELRVSYDMIPAQAWNTEPDGLYPAFNKQWHDYTGISPESARTGGWVDSYHPEDREKVLRKWTELLQTGTAGEIEARIVRHDGVSRVFLVRGSPMRDERGAILKWFGTHTDIDDLKRIEEAQELLARAGRLTALGELTASIAHEVNQPLMAIVTNAATCLRWLSDDLLDVREAREAAERIIRDGHRAGDVITSIRAMARKSPLAMEDVDVNAMVEDVLVLTRGELQRHGITLQKELAADVGSAVGDRIQLQQVVLNLILNAVEAIGSSERGSRGLQVTSERSDDGKVLVTVADSGPGIDVAKLDQIFEAFFTTKTGGLGMGLSICRSIVEAHGGRLWVSPNDPDGSVFSFTLRAAAP
ncbi:multi-sensor signal transduction multi-kinase [Rhizobium leguminosarum bv. trifolii WSM1325]|uniref:histidine kinase n=1 Tax=Rhizobium leguminosarum bv. trifolii (strain WSM1325) TaxID=395491 RepID=C6AVP1_RHILS|nr:AAA family ATPase [Rhizobium leguminosarum]ACS55852.1 multi-sensor signal transduction multi-kinase [Rhizobium leguminosarum bv. trifolii WSM1325]